MVTRNHWVRLYVIFLKVLGWVIFAAGVLGGLATGLHALKTEAEWAVGLVTCVKRIAAGTAAASVATAPMYLIAYAFDLALQVEENTRRTLIAVERLLKEMER